MYDIICLSLYISHPMIDKLQIRYCQYRIFYVYRVIIQRAEHMCKEMEQLCDERELETKKNVAYSLAEKKMSVEDIAEVIKVNIETVKSWLASTTAAR